MRSGTLFPKFKHSALQASQEITLTILLSVSYIGPNWQYKASTAEVAEY